VHFDDFRYDPGARQLLRGEAEVRVAPKAFDLLGALLRVRPRALAKAQLMALLWPRTAVVEANLTNLVAELRQVLGDPPRKPRYIRTVYAFGYAFCGEAVEEGDAPSPATSAFRILWEKREIPLEFGENVLGRSRDAIVWIASESVSRRHARILITGKEALLEDLNSKNGTWLHETRIRTAVPLLDGDEFRVGAIRLVFRAAAGPDETQTGDDT
jgi:DNA-binding winged helix-turn-helix (wHTH) protein